MTHLTILALGSQGDVFPYVVLGQGLQAAGFAVRVISFENFGPQHETTMVFRARRL